MQKIAKMICLKNDNQVFHLCQLPFLFHFLQLYLSLKNAQFINLRHKLDIGSICTSDEGRPFSFVNIRSAISIHFFYCQSKKLKKEIMALPRF